MRFIYLCVVALENTFIRKLSQYSSRIDLDDQGLVASEGQVAEIHSGSHHIPTIPQT